MKGISQSVFADMLTSAGSPATQGLISQWESGEVRIPAERCVAIARVTCGAVDGHDLRPDIFGPPSSEDGDDEQLVQELYRQQQALPTRAPSLRHEQGGVL